MQHADMDIALQWLTVQLSKSTRGTSHSTATPQCADMTIVGLLPWEQSAARIHHDQLSCLVSVHAMQHGLEVHFLFVLVALFLGAQGHKLHYLQDDSSSFC